MRLLAIDYGDQRLGLAISDQLQITVRPLTTIDRSPTAKSFKAIADLVSEMEVEKVVVGLPIRLDGTRGDAVLRVEKFIERLQQFISCPIVGWDEKLTSYEAEERMRQAGLKAHERKKRIDEFAAVVILEDYIHLSNSKL